MTCAKIILVGRNWRLSALLIACFVFGGTSQAVWHLKIIIYLISVAIIANTLASPDRKKVKSLLSAPYLFLILLVIVTILYLVPLPPQIWTALQGRDLIETGFVLAGFNLQESSLPWMPLSLTPENTSFAIFNLLPPLAIACVMGLSADREEIQNSQYALIAFACISALLGIGQSFTKFEALYLYEVTNFGRSVGFFSNANHNGCFLAMVIPISIYHLLRSLRSGVQLQNALKARSVICALSLVLCSAGIIMTGSVAGYIMLLISIIGGILISIKSNHNKLGSIFILVPLIGFIADFFIFSGHLSEMLVGISSQSELSRSTILRASMEIQRTFGAAGIGPGAFEDSYRIFENRKLLGSKHVNEAHNDYIQVWLEFGYVGFIGITIGIFWYIKKSFSNLRGITTSNRLPLIFSLIGLIPILHSMVDYPLRTIALSAFFTYALILMTDAKNAN